MAATSNDDFYPTRLRSPRARIDRREPVVDERARRRRGPLSLSQIDFFERYGYLALDGVFAEEEVRPFLDELESLQRELGEADSIIRDRRTGEIRSIFGMHEISDRFAALTRDERLLAAVAQLYDDDVYIHQSRMNDKPPFRGRGFNWHSDFETWHAEDGMPAMRAVSCSVLLTDNTEFNGPLMLVPGSHWEFLPCVGETPADNWKQSLQTQTIGVPEARDLRAMVDAGGIVAPKGRAGSVLFFECNTLHASNRNLSPTRRANLFFVYNCVSNALRAPYAGTKPRPEFLGSRASRALRLAA